MSEVQVCTFRVGHNLLGLRIEDVAEIARPQRLAKVPLAPRPIVGLMNLRGDIVPTIEARACLGLPKIPADERSASVILRGDVPVSLFVDEVGDIVTLSEDDFERPPEHIQGVMKQLVRAVVQLGDQLLLVVSSGAFLELATEAEAS